MRHASYYYVEIMGYTAETHVTHAVLVPEKWKRDTVLRLSGWAGGHLALASGLSQSTAQK